jgi:hypothetical protein
MRRESEKCEVLYISRYICKERLRADGSNGAQTSSDEESVHDALPALRTCLVALGLLSTDRESAPWKIPVARQFQPWPLKLYTSHTPLPYLLAPSVAGIRDSLGGT